MTMPAYGPRTHRVRNKAQLDEMEKSLRNAAIWDELKDRLKKCHGPFGRPAAETLYRQGSGSGAGGAPDG